jgi:hypothetical protein
MKIIILVYKNNNVYSVNYLVRYVNLKKFA